MKRSRGVVPLLLPLMEYLDSGTTHAFPRCVISIKTPPTMHSHFITKKIYDNNGIRNKLEAWLIFLSDDNPETIMQWIETYPEFREMYEEIYDLCMNTEKVMNMFSKELLELHRNTVQLMIDEMQDEIDSQKVQLQEKDAKIAEMKAEIARLKAQQ